MSKTSPTLCPDFMLKYCNTDQNMFPNFCYQTKKIEDHMFPFFPFVSSPWRKCPKIEGHNSRDASFKSL